MGVPVVALHAGPRDKLRLAFTVNGEGREVLVEPWKTLLEVLREDLGLTGTKHGCELGECGACAVLADGELVLSCLVPAVECQGRAVTTVEGLRDGPELHPLQAAFADHGAAQCGYCTPGMLVAAKWLLDRQPDATRDQIAEALSGQLCRCTGYLQIYEAVEAAGRVLRGLPAPAPRLPPVHRANGHGRSE
ncbi:MAG TPA: (2Fe-2S)-binding protein [Anaeromyxobacteraceae bacterium]|nr:(2Fe-2S)-binding protein [Anaeromyxobacteraceae bacterium]